MGTCDLKWQKNSLAMTGGPGAFDRESSLGSSDSSCSFRTVPQRDPFCTHTSCDLNGENHAEAQMCQITSTWACGIHICLGNCLGHTLLPCHLSPSECSQAVRGLGFHPACPASPGSSGISPARELKFIVRL